jgi:2-(1,2-epoxy-1,2-dihydrophenyl)acetyl-CoA isomerase
MSESELLTKIDGAVAWLTFNRPDVRNALTANMLAQMAIFLQTIEEDPKVRCLVMSGAGEHFMAGGDVAAFQSALGLPANTRAADFKGRAERSLPVFEELARFSKPIIAKVRGACAGASISWVTAADFVLISDTALFAFAHIHLGLSPDGGLSYYLPRAVGDRKARELILLGEQVTAQEAVAIGLANRLVPDDDLDAETEKLACRFAEGPALAIASSKQLLRLSLANSREEQMRLEIEAFAACAENEDLAEGVRAFMQKRKPTFRSR